MGVAWCSLKATGRIVAALCSLVRSDPRAGRVPWLLEDWWLQQQKSSLWGGMRGRKLKFRQRHMLASFSSNGHVHGRSQGKQPVGWNDLVEHRTTEHPVPHSDPIWGTPVDLLAPIISTKVPQ